MIVINKVLVLHRIRNTDIMKTIHTNLTSKIQDLKSSSKYNMSRIMRRARFIYLNRTNYMYDYSSIKTWSDALKQSWLEAKQVVNKVREQLTLSIKSLSKAFTPQLPTQWGQDQLIKNQFTAYNAGTKLN